MGVAEAGPLTDELELDIALRLEAMKLDQIASELDDTHRLPHVEHEGIAGGGQHRRLQDQLHGLGNRHEVAHCLWIGNGQRASARKLPTKQGNHAATAAQDIPKTDRGVGKIVRDGDLMHKHFTDAFRSSHHTRRVHGLVTRDENETANARGHGRIQHIRRSRHVGHYSFFGKHLHERHMLVRCSVKDDVWANLSDQPKQLCTLADVHDHRSDFGSALHCGKAVESLKDTVLASPEQDDSSRVKSQGLTSEFPANGTARTGDEDAATAKRLRHGR